MNKKNKTFLLLLLLISISVRLFFFLSTTRGEEPLSFYEFLYQENANKISGKEDGWSSYTLSSFYASYLSFLSRLVSDADAPRIVSHILGITLVLLTFVLGTRLFSKSTGFVAGLIVAFSGSELYFEGKLLPYSLLSFTGVLLSLVILNVRETGKLAYSFILGILCALAYLLWPNGWALVLVALVSLLLIQKTASRGKKAASVVLFVLGFLFLTLPFLMNNYRTSQELIVSSSGSGVNFFFGNQETFSGVPFTIRLAEFSTVSEQARWQAGSSLREYQVSLFLYGKTLRDFLREPFSHLWLMVKKLYSLVGSYEIPTDESLYSSLKREAPPFQYLLYLSVIIMPFFLVGLFNERNKLPELIPVLFPFLSALVVNVIFLTSSGERLFGLASFSILGSATLTKVFARDTLTRKKPALLGLVAITGVLLFLPGQGLRKQGENPSRNRFLLGTSYAMQGRVQEAISQFEKALSLDRTNIDARLGMASILASDGVFEEAKAHYLKALAIDSTNAFAYLGLCQLSKEPLPAFEFSRKALEKKPYLADAHNALGVSLLNLGYFQEAYDEFKTAEFLRPGHRAAMDNIAALRRAGFLLPETRGAGGAFDEMTTKEMVALAMEDIGKGLFDQARRKLEAASKKEPESLEVVYGFATLSLQEDRLDDAISGYKKLIQRGVSNSLVLNNLASAHARKGELKEAIRLWEQILAVSPSNELASRNLERAKAELGKSGKKN